MRVSYEVPKSAVVSILLLFIGVFLIIKGGGVFYRYHHASALMELSREECRFYTISLANGRYIQIMAAKKEK